MTSLSDGYNFWEVSGVDHYFSCIQTDSILLKEKEEIDSTKDPPLKDENKQKELPFISDDIEDYLRFSSENDCKEMLSEDYYSSSPSSEMFGTQDEGSEDKKTISTNITSDQNQKKNFFVNKKIESNNSERRGSFETNLSGWEEDSNVFNPLSEEFLAQFQIDPTEQSEFLYKPDVMRKTVLRSLRNVPADYLRMKLREYELVKDGRVIFGTDLKKSPSKYKHEIYDFIKKSFEEVIGNQISESQFLKVYGILFYFIFAKKNIADLLIDLDPEIKFLVNQENELFRIQCTKCSANHGRILRNHEIMITAKKMIRQSPSLAQKFWERAFSCNKKKGINDFETFKAKIDDELSLVPDDLIDFDRL